MGPAVAALTERFLVDDTKPFADERGLSCRPALESGGLRDDVAPVPPTRTFQRPVALPAVPSESLVQPLVWYDRDFHVLDDAHGVASPVRDHASVSRLRDSLPLRVVLPLQGTRRGLDPSQHQVRDLCRRPLRAEMEHPVVLSCAWGRGGHRLQELRPVLVDPAPRHATATTRALADAPPRGAG